MTRYSAVEEARFNSFVARNATLRLVGLSVCTNVSPFAARCGRAYLDDYLYGAPLEPYLQQIGAVRIDGGRACWLIPADWR